MRLGLFLKALWPVNWYLLIFTLFIFALLLNLGLWQSDRAIAKEQRIVKIEQFTKQAAMPLDSVLTEFTDVNNHELLNDFPVLLNGEFDADLLFILDNQTNEGRLGYRVFQLFNHFNQTHNQVYRVLINLGWVPGSINRQELPDINPMIGKYTLTGHIRFMERGIVLADEQLAFTGGPIRIQSVDITKISRLIDKQLLPFAVFLDKKEEVGYIKNWQPIVMPPEKHRAYAFQWFSLAAAWLMLMIWAGVKHNLNHNKVNNNKKIG